MMQNESGENVDLYVPRKCSWSHRLIRAKDHASIQVNVAQIDPVTGIFTGQSTPLALAGYIRFKAEGDMALTTLVQEHDAQLYLGGATIGGAATAAAPAAVSATVSATPDLS